MKAYVTVMLKSDVLDPQGAAISRASASLGYDWVRDVRQGKIFEVEVDAADEASARSLIEELAAKLLANPVIEDFKLEKIEP
ncbi:MAG: phosphoribosylformylglycinamidine synthase subunit PurS [Myxococcota bacterium]